MPACSCTLPARYQTATSTALAAVSGASRSCMPFLSVTRRASVAGAAAGDTAPARGAAVSAMAITSSAESADGFMPRGPFAWSRSVLSVNVTRSRGRRRDGRRPPASWCTTRRPWTSKTRSRGSPAPGLAPKSTRVAGAESVSGFAPVSRRNSARGSAATPEERRAAAPSGTP